MGPKERFYSLVALFGIGATAGLSCRFQQPDVPSPTPIVRELLQESEIHPSWETPIPQTIAPTLTAIPEPLKPAGQTIPVEISGIGEEPTQEFTGETEIPSYEIPPSKSWEELNQNLQKEIDNFPGIAAFSFVDLKTGKGISINGEMSFYPFSTVKCLILVSVLRDIQSGLYSLDDVESTIESMMTYSDNTAADELIEQTGIEKIHDLVPALGMENSGFFNGFELDGPYMGYGLNYSTTSDLALFWTKLYRGEILSPEFTSLALSFARMPETRIIYSGQEAQVSHKPGYYYDNYLLDAGVVMTADGAYSVGFYGQDEEGLSYDLGNRLTQMVWDFWQSQNGTKE